MPILANDPVEEFEFFSLMLSDVQGGAGLGTRNGTIEILADGSPAGQFAIEPSSLLVAEGQSATVSVLRPYYSAGAVSVTLSPIAGTATAGDDFAPEPVTVAWADGDSSRKLVEFAIPDDTSQEASESFTVELQIQPGEASSASNRASRLRLRPATSHHHHRPTRAAAEDRRDSFRCCCCALPDCCDRRGSPARSRPMTENTLR